MTIKSIASAWLVPPTSDTESGPRPNTLSLLLGAGFTLLLFTCIALYEMREAKGQSQERDELHVALMPFEPPPPPAAHAESDPDATPMVGFRLSPSDSSVRISVSPPDLDSILPEDLSKAPHVDARIGPLRNFGPKIDFASDPKHVFESSEVDQVPRVLFREPPEVPGYIAKDAEMLVTTLMAIIDADGTIGSVRVARSSGNPTFDAITAKNIMEWGFSPAIKGGKRVRCLIEQDIIVRFRPESPFESRAP
jgi:TonB family protein